MLWYSLEAPRRGASNEYPQHMFSLRNKKNISIFRMKKAPYLLLWLPTRREGPQLQDPDWPILEYEYAAAALDPYTNICIQ